MPTVFSRIAAGEIPCYKVAENDEFLAFLDITPVCEGHTLVIPKKETDYIFDLDNDHLCRLHLFAKLVAAKMRKAVPCQRIGIAVVGLEVPHAHIHLLPLRSMDDIDFKKPRLKLSAERMNELAAQIAAC